MCSRAWPIWALAVALAGCTPQICGRSSDCASGLVCSTIGACVVRVDAASDDSAGEIDASITAIRDASGDTQGIEPIDAAALDAPEATDASPSDADPSDGNPIDAPGDDGLAAARARHGVW